MRLKNSHILPLAAHFSKHTFAPTTTTPTTSTPRKKTEEDENSIFNRGKKAQCTFECDPAQSPDNCTMQREVYCWICMDEIEAAEFCSM